MEFFCGYMYGSFADIYRGLFCGALLWICTHSNTHCSTGISQLLILPSLLIRNTHRNSPHRTLQHTLQYTLQHSLQYTLQYTLQRRHLAALNATPSAHSQHTPQPTATHTTIRTATHTATLTATHSATQASRSSQRCHLSSVPGGKGDSNP